jgi:hypothetical protein
MSRSRTVAALLLAICAVSPLLVVSGSAAQSSTKENWQDLSLDTSQLSIAKPIVGETDDLSNFTRQLVEVRWRPTDPIYLYIMLPKLVRKPPVILYLYTYPTDLDRFQHERFCDELVKGGYAAVGFSSALTAHRYHDRPMKQWFVSELPESLGATTHDVQMILNYLGTRGDVDVEHAGMFGEGSGASIAILSAAVDPRLKAIDLLNPWGDWPDWLAKSSVVPETERSQFLTPEFLKSVAGLDPIRWLPQLHQPVRLQFMNEGKEIPGAARKKIEAAAPPQATVVPSEKALADYQATNGANFLDWIKQQLASPAKN